MPDPSDREDKLDDLDLDAEENEIDRRIKRLGLDTGSATEKAVEEGNKIDAEFEQRLKELEGRASTQKATRDNQQRETNRQMQRDRESARGLGIGMSIAYTIIGLPLFGAGVGWLLDRQTGSEGWKGICMLIGAIVGIGMTFYMLNKQNNNR